MNKIRPLKQKKQIARSERVTAKYSKDYSECNKETKKKIRKYKREYFKAKANEAEEAAKKGQQGEIFKITKELSGKYNSGSSVIKDKNGNKITLDEKQLEKWAEHFSEVLIRPMPSDFPDIDEGLTGL